MFHSRQEIKNTRAHLCLDCGKCTVVCPVARYDSQFNPRLIVQRNLGLNGANPKDETIWACLNCYMCLERCNYRVEFPEFIRILRTEAFNAGVRAQCTHGGVLQSLMKLMTDEELRQKRLDWLPSDIELSQQSDTVFFVGCAPYFDVLFGEIKVSALEGVKGALRLLNLAHIPFNLMANERCCGRDLFLQGDKEGFMALAKRNAAEFAQLGVKKIITACPECYYSLKLDYPRMLGKTVGEVVYWTEIIAPLLQYGEFRLGVIKQRVTYHDSCVLGRGLRIFESPRQVLCAISGLELVEMEQSREKALCCGASSWVHCGVTNRRIQDERLAQAEATGAGVMVTSCPKCQIHLRCAQQSRYGNVPKIKIEDLACLVARSLD